MVDNVTDLLALDSGPARRLFIGDAARGSSPLFEGGWMYEGLVAEHGFSVLVTVERGGVTHRILFDAGLSPDALVTNMRRLGLDPSDVEAIVLSHGHSDHTTGLDGFIRAVGRVSLPVHIHPDFWNRRRLVIPGQDPIELPTVSRQAASSHKAEDGKAHTHEVKLVCVFRQATVDEDGSPVRDPRPSSYLATFAAAAKFGVLMAAEAHRRGADHVHQLVILGDGAQWIWNLATTHFPAAT